MNTNKWFCQWHTPPEMPKKKGMYFLAYTYINPELKSRLYYTSYTYSGMGSFFFEPDEATFEVACWTEIKPFEENA